MRNKDELKNVLNDESLEQVVGGVDDGSPDNTGEILDEYVKKDKRVKVISNGATLEPREPGKPEAGPAGGGADIHVPEGSTLIIVGDGKLGS